MSSENIAIRVQNLSKCYQIYGNPRDRLKQFVLPRLQRMSGQTPRQYFREFWALKDISFEIKKGETVGIIGRNGSGKSTLLQLICGTLSPTGGGVETNGRIAALLELGSGFNPEFTGRENVYMNAAILGLLREEIDSKYDEIVAFAEIGDFVDQPVKTYSSGMYVRLAFAVAINVEPDILIVDEALAVGDMLFQAKCMIKMRQMMESGVTVLFVSHDTGTVRSLCQKCLFLERGTMVGFGKTSEVVDAYDVQMNLSLNAELKTRVEIKPPPQNVVATPQETKQTDIKDIRVSSSDEAHQFAKGYHQYGEGGARILDVKLLNSLHQVTDQLETHEPFIIQFSVLFNRDMENYAVGYSIQDVKGLRMLGGMTTSYPEYSPPKATKGDIYVFEIRGINVLTQDIYTLSLFVEIPVLINERHFVEGAIENAIVFRSKFPADRTSWIYSRVFTPVEFAHAKAPA